MICKRYALVWLAALMVSSAHAQFGFLDATKEPIPPVEVPKDEILEMADSIRNDYGSEAVVASEIAMKLPMPADDYPDNLKGVLWMDQYGEYGYQNISAASPAADENLLTFGDAHLHTLDTETRIQLLSPGCGGAWTIDSVFWGIPVDDYHSEYCAEPAIYQFAWNEDYTISSIYQYNATLDVVGFDQTLSMMRVPDQPEGTCPPAEDATPEERNLCAKFIRVTYGANNPNGFIYPVFEIVGADGVPREPYYSAFVDWMERKNATMQYWRPLKATADAEDAGDGDTDGPAPTDAGNGTDAPASTTDAPTTAAPTSAAATVTVTSFLALLVGAAVMMV